MRLLIVGALVFAFVALIVFGLLQGWFMTWGRFTDEELEEMGVKPRRKIDVNND